MPSDLTAPEVKAKKEPGRYRVSKGLYLQVDGGSRAWIHRFMLNGVSHDMGLGSCDLITLAKARDLVIDARRLAAAGQCPLAARKAARPVVRPTFKTVAIEYHKTHANGWKNLRYRIQWMTQLESYVFPTLGDMTIDTITSTDVRNTFKPIWPGNAEATHPLVCATVLLGRVEEVWLHAKAQGFVAGDCPATWEGCQKSLLGVIQHNKTHKTSMPWEELPGFMVELRACRTIEARALEFTILTAARTDECLDAVWIEIDLEAATWTVPGEKMKNGDEHVVPLSDAAVRLLRGLKTNRAPDSPVFSGRGQRLHASAMLFQLAKFGRTAMVKGVLKPVTPHGFRTSLRTYGLEHHYREITLEMALAHRQKAEILEAYTQGTLLAERTRLMADWATHCGG